MAAQAPARKDTQLGLYAEWTSPRRVRPSRRAPTLCTGCQAKEARYGFREHAGGERPRTLCFECFRMELERRQRALEQRAQGWDGEQASLPLADTLRALTTRRRRAQIAARRVVGFIECP